MYRSHILETTIRGKMVGEGNRKSTIKQDNQLLDNETKGLENYSFEDEMLYIADDSSTSAIGIFLGNYYFGIC